MACLQISNPDEGITLLTLDRPAKLNAMNVELISELHDALDSIRTDRACRAVIITGAGRGFCAGLDLHGYGRAPCCLALTPSDECRTLAGQRGGSTRWRGKRSSSRRARGWPR